MPGRKAGPTRAAAKAEFAAYKRAQEAVAKEAAAKEAAAKEAAAKETAAKEAAAREAVAKQAAEAAAKDAAAKEAAAKETAAKEAAAREAVAKQAAEAAAKEAAKKQAAAKEAAKKQAAEKEAAAEETAAKEAAEKEAAAEDLAAKEAAKKEAAAKQAAEEEAAAEEQAMIQACLENTQMTTDSLLPDPEVARELASPVSVISSALTPLAPATADAAVAGPAKRARSTEYFRLQKKFTRRLVSHPLPDDLAEKYGKDASSLKGQLFRLWLESGGPNLPPAESWAKVRLEEDFAHQHKQQQGDEFQFLTKAELQTLPRFAGNDDLVHFHISRCRDLGLWRRSPEFPQDDRLDEFWTRVASKAKDTQETQQRSCLRLEAQVDNKSVPGLLQPRGSFGALPHIPGINPQAQMNAWSPRYTSGLEGEPPSSLALLGRTAPMSQPSSSARGSPPRKAAKPKAKARVSSEDTRTKGLHVPLLDAATVTLEAVKFHATIIGQTMKLEVALKQAEDIHFSSRSKDRLIELVPVLQGKAEEIMALVMKNNTDVATYRPPMEASVHAIAEAKIHASALNTQLKAQQKVTKHLPQK